MTQPINDLAAQMVREIHAELEKRGTILVNYAPIFEPIARRYMEKADRVKSAAVQMREGIRRAGCKRHPELYVAVMQFDAVIRAEHAGKESVNK